MISYNQMPRVDTNANRIREKTEGLAALLEGKFVYDIEEGGYRLVVAVRPDPSLVSRESGRYKNAYLEPVVFVAEVGVTAFDLEDLNIKKSDIAALRDAFDRYDPNDIDCSQMTIIHGDIRDCARPPPPDSVNTEVVSEITILAKRKRSFPSDDDISFSVGAGKFLDIISQKVVMSSLGNYLYGELKRDIVSGFGNEESFRTCIIDAFKYYSLAEVLACVSIDFEISTACSSRSGSDKQKIYLDLVENVIAHCIASV